MVECNFYLTFLISHAFYSCSKLCMPQNPLICYKFLDFG
uniref:Uncharacterized protein n=1 Tax=Rhizophora mucronata TaxID=61149 RepID=A0A2P2P6H7_RHIMU